MKSAENILRPTRDPLKTGILVLDDSNMLSFAAAVDPMRAANRRAGRMLFDWSFLTPTGEASRLTSGLSVDGTAIADLDRCDFLIIVAGFHVDSHASPRLLASLRRIAEGGATIAGLDGGPWLMARAGLLDDHAATAHWEELEDFAARFPRIEARRDRFCISGARITCGGAAPGIDMMLHLIRARHGDELATQVASALLYDPAEGPQSPVSTARRIRRNPQVASAIALMEATLDDPLPIPALAARLGLSARSLETRFKTHLGRSPQAYYLRLRLSEAHRMATDTRLPVQEIAMATGFASQSVFARAFRARFGLSVRALRRTRGTLR